MASYYISGAKQCREICTVSCIRHQMHFIICLTWSHTYHTYHGLSRFNLNTFGFPLTIPDQIYRNSILGGWQQLVKYHWNKHHCLGLGSDLCGMDFWCATDGGFGKQNYGIAGCLQAYYSENVSWVITAWIKQSSNRHYMMTSSNRNIFRVTGPVTGEFPSQRPVARSFDAFFDLRLNKRLRKQMRRRWLKTPSRSLWYYGND